MRKIVNWSDYFRERTTISPDTSCWDWQLARDRDGYGRCYALRDMTAMAHRASYLMLVGPIGAGLTLDHLCRNRACVNPKHLEPVSQHANTLRSPNAPSTINAAKSHCANGHPFDDENTRHGGGRRHCRACNRAAVARYVARRAGAA